MSFTKRLKKYVILLTSKEIRKNYSLENYIKVNNKANSISNIIFNGV